MQSVGVGRRMVGMARYTTTLMTDAPAQVVLDHLADFASVADWDPGVTAAALISGEPGRVGARYSVTVSFGPRRIPLEYAVVERVDPVGAGPGHVVLVAESGLFTSHDTITVTPTSSGSQVQYDAILTLHGLGRVLDWPLQQSFQVIGRRAEQGLRAELDGLAGAIGSSSA
jgi:Polyketide cyclase / dehydrase and lipid transport